MKLALARWPRSFADGPSKMPCSCSRAELEVFARCLYDWSRAREQGAGVGAPKIEGVGIGLWLANCTWRTNCGRDFQVATLH